MSEVPERLAALFPAALRDRLIALRQELHRHPELSLEEERTATTLTAALAEVEPAELRRVAGTGVVARIAGAERRAPTVVVRGDVDALPIDEATDLDFRSERPGVMHACGHDVHATWAVGAAHLLAARPARGDVLILLQPAEEVARGAREVLASGALDGAAAIFGAHVDRRFAVGEVVADAGPLAAAADSFALTLHGAGAHGARPHEGDDPIVGLGALITALQTVVSRRVAPDRAAVVSIGTVQAGRAANVIPDRATMTGTLRSEDAETRDLLRRELRRLAERTAEAHGLTARLEIEALTPPLVNEEAPVAWARRAVTSLLGAAALRPLGRRNLAGEDFAWYLERLPGCFLRIGAREEGGEVIPAHSPRFYAAAGAIFVGAAVLAETARLASAELARGEGV